MTLGIRSCRIFKTFMRLFSWVNKSQFLKINSLIRLSTSKLSFFQTSYRRNLQIRRNLLICRCSSDCQECEWEILYTQEISALQTKKSNKKQLWYRIPLLTPPNSLLNSIITMNLSEEEGLTKEFSLSSSTRPPFYSYFTIKWKQRHSM